LAELKQNIFISSWGTFYSFIIKCKLEDEVWKCDEKNICEGIEHRILDELEAEIDEFEDNFSISSIQ